MFGYLPSVKPKKLYCVKCGAEQGTGPDWRFGVGLKGWSHVHQDGTAYHSEWLTDEEHAKRFPPTKVIQKDGGSCIIFDIGS